MPVTQIDGGRQVKDGSVTLVKLAEAVIQADGGQAFTADQPMGGFKLTGLGAPSADTDSATKGYVDSVVQGLDPKGSVKALATTNITLSGTQTIDGVALSADDRVLLTGNTDPAENGIWLVKAGAWARPTDFDAAGDISEGAYTFVEEGTAYEGIGFVLTELAGTFGGGFTTQTWQQFSGAGQVTAGSGLTKTGNTLDVQVGDGIEINSDAVRVKLDGATLTRSGSGLKVTDGTYAAASHTHASTDVTDFAEAVSDQVGAMVTGNAETGIAVTYQDSDNTLDFALDDEYIQDLIGAMVSGNTETNITVTYDDTNGKLDFVASGGGSTRVVRETPSGSVNGSNTAFVLADAPAAGSEEVFLNGILQEPGAGNDYTISGDTITYLTAPVTGDRLRVSYVPS